MLVMTIVVLVVMMPVMFKQKEFFTDLSLQDAKAEIGAIYEEALYHTRYPGVVPTMSFIQAEGFELNEFASIQWEFTIFWPDSIDAISKERMPNGTGNRLVYRIKDNAFFGFRQSSYGNVADFEEYEIELEY